MNVVSRALKTCIMNATTWIVADTRGLNGKSREIGTALNVLICAEVMANHVEPLRLS